MIRQTYWITQIGHSQSPRIIIFMFRGIAGEMAVLYQLLFQLKHSFIHTSVYLTSVQSSLLLIQTMLLSNVFVSRRVSRYNVVTYHTVNVQVMVSDEP